MKSLKKTAEISKNVYFIVFSFIFLALARIVEDESNATRQLVNPKSARKAQAGDLIELAKEVQRADEEVRHVASGKLQIIAEQIRFLQEQVA